MALFALYFDRLEGFSSRLALAACTISGEIVEIEAIFRILSISAWT